MGWRDGGTVGWRDGGVEVAMRGCGYLDEGHDDPEGVGEHVTHLWMGGEEQEEEEHEEEKEEEHEEEEQEEEAHLGVGLLPRHSLLEDVDGDPEGLPLLPILETPEGGGGLERRRRGRWRRGRWRIGRWRRGRWRRGRWRRGRWRRGR